MNNLKRILAQDIIQADFYQMPKFLFFEQFDDISNDAIVLYSLLKDRFQLSLKNNWVNSDGEVYLIFTREEMGRMLRRGETKTLKVFKELCSFGLVQEQQQGKNQPNLIYLCCPIIENTWGLAEQGSGVLQNKGQGSCRTSSINTNINQTNRINTHPSDAAQNQTKSPLILGETKKTKKSKDIATMRSMIAAFTQNEEIREKLTEYFSIRLKKGLQPNQWQIILDDLRKYAGTDADLAIEQINGAIAGGYMQIIADWKKNIQAKGKKPAFDNLGGKQVPSFDPKKDKLATNKDGKPIVF